jgi:hypothetical protein
MQVGLALLPKDARITIATTRKRIPRIFPSPQRCSAIR